MPIVESRDPEIRRLSNHLRAIGDARWARDYLAAARLLVETLGLGTDDIRVNASLPRKAAQWLLPITINRRYVLVAQRDGPQRLVGVIWGPLFDKIPRLHRQAVRTWRFGPHSGEDAFDTPWFVRFDDPRLLFEDDELRAGWLEAARRELGRGRVSPFRKHHSDMAFRMIVDWEFQERVVEEVLGKR